MVSARRYLQFGPATVAGTCEKVLAVWVVDCGGYLREGTCGSGRTAPAPCHRTR